jgi:hypothetical protein
MPVKNPKELFVMLLGDARQSTERSTKIYQEISQAAQDAEIKEALESRAWISEKDLSAIGFQLHRDSRWRNPAARPESPVTAGSHSARSYVWRLFSNPS